MQNNSHREILQMIPTFTGKLDEEYFTRKPSKYTYLKREVTSHPAIDRHSTIGLKIEVCRPYSYHAVLCQWEEPEGYLKYTTHLWPLSVPVCDTSCLQTGSSQLTSCLKVCAFDPSVLLRLCS